MNDYTELGLLLFVTGALVLLAVEYRNFFGCVVLVVAAILWPPIVAAYLALIIIHTISE
jgi:hypothetical protein